ncbi:MAG: response regulator [Planctomycetota bacterium]
MAKEKVLLVDDEKEFTELLSERMGSRDVEVDTAASGPEALQKAKDNAYDAVILDLAMPEMDGIETLKHLLKENPDLQIILLTGHASLEKGVEAVKLGAMDFIEKPAEIKTLMEKIQKAKANKMLIVEKKMEEKIKGILGTKWW